jgi:hypothetical protein
VNFRIISERNGALSGQGAATGEMKAHSQQVRVACDAKRWHLLVSRIW